MKLILLIIISIMLTDTYAVIDPEQWGKACQKLLNPVHQQEFLDAISIRDLNDVVIIKLGRQFSEADFIGELNSLPPKEKYNKTRGFGYITLKSSRLREPPVGHGKISNYIIKQLMKNEQFQSLMNSKNHLVLEYRLGFVESGYGHFIFDGEPGYHFDQLFGNYLYEVLENNNFNAKSPGRVVVGSLFEPGMESGTEMVLLNDSHPLLSEEKMKIFQSKFEFSVNDEDINSAIEYLKKEGIIYTQKISSGDVINISNWEIHRTPITVKNGWRYFFRINISKY